MISRIYIHNYRCFVNFELHLRQTELLLGYNGVGKTSLFDLLGAIQDLIIWNREASDAFPSDTLTRFGDSVNQRFELDITCEFGLLRYTLVLEHNPDEGWCKIATEEVTLGGDPLYRFSDTEVQLYRDDSTPARDTFSFSPRRSFLASLEPKRFNRKLTQLKSVIEGIWILRIDPASIESSAPEEDDSLDRDASNFASWCRHLLQDAPDKMEEATRAIEKIIPGFQRLRMQTAGRSKVLVSTFTIPGGRAYDLDFDMLSDGQRVLIVLYVLLASVANRAHILCLDEPDNFVSLREIQPFLVAMRDAADEHGVQALLISHSSEVIDYLGPSEAILLERPDGASTRPSAPAEGRSLRFSELLARGWHTDKGGHE